MLTKTDLIEQLWELYTLEKFDNIIQLIEGQYRQELQNNIHIYELYSLSLIEKKSYKNNHHTNGIFNELISAMNDYHNQNFQTCGKKLGNWLLNKGFFAEWIVNRFYECIRNSKQYDLLLKVSLHLLKKYPDNSRYIQYLFYSYFYLKNYEKALQVFEKFRELFNEEDLQMIGYIYLKLKKYEEAERIFLRVYKKITGKDYQNNYAKIEAKYKLVYNELKEKYYKNQLVQKELIEFGMACLFNGDYKTALQIFTKIKSTIEKNL